jgi:diguanylate cyclase (GGDEF)-like protein
MNGLASLSALSEATREIGLSDDLDTLIDSILERAQALIGFEHCALLLPDPATGELAVARARGYGSRREDILNLRLARGTGISGRCAEERRAIRVGDVRTDPTYVVGLDSARSNLAVPLVLGSEVVGVLNVESDRTEAFSESDEKLLTVLGAQAALAITAARERGRVQKRLRQLDALYRISRVSNQRRDLDETLSSILDIACELSPNTECHMAFLLPDPETGSLRIRAARGYGEGLEDLRIAPGEGVTGRCAATGRPVIVEDVHGEAGYIAGVPGGRSEIAVPLVVEGQVIGVLDAESRKPGAFGAEEERTLTVIAQQAAAVIQTVQLHEEARRLAVTDSLTGLHNRRFFLERLEEHLQRCERYGERLALLLLDFDYLKEVNDFHGHQVGDRALCAVARLLESSLRETDEVARIGGDEFAAAILQADAELIETVHQRMRRAIDDLDFVDDEGQPMQLSLSAGVAFFPEDADGPDLLLQRADEALYRAKRRGRNQIAVFDPTRVPPGGRPIQSGVE